MQAFTAPFTRLYWRTKSGNAVKDETVPFAQNNHGEFCHEAGDFDTGKSMNNNHVEEISLQKPKRREMLRRDTVTGIEKPTISAWDAGWNVSNAIQVRFLRSLILL